jgi:hypothetical protein
MPHSLVDVYSISEECAPFIFKVERKPNGEKIDEDIGRGAARI